MSEKLLKIFLNELKTVRLVCKRSECGAVVEMSLARFAANNILECPACRTSFMTTQHNGQMDPLVMLARGMNTLAGTTDRFEVQFVIPVND